MSSCVYVFFAGEFRLSDQDTGLAAERDWSWKKMRIRLSITFLILCKLYRSVIFNIS